MKFTLDSGQGVLVHAYQSGEVTLKVPTDNPGQPYRVESHSTSLILGGADATERWPVKTMEELVTQHFEPVWQIEPDIVLLGTGERLVFPAMELRQDFVLKGIGLEVMDTAAACRTYNVLAAEGRRVMALLIIE